MELLDRKEIMPKLEKKFQEIFELLQLKEHGVPEEHIKDSPKRISKMLLYELLDGVYSTPEKYKLTEFSFDRPNDVYSTYEIVSVDNVEVKSLCSHHFMPFFGEAFIAYIPDQKILGLSKFARMVDYFSRRPQVQEELNKQIVEFIYEQTQPLAAGCLIKAVHTCMRHRGAKSNGEMITLYVKGKDDIVKKDLEDYLRQKR